MYIKRLKFCKDAWHSWLKLLRTRVFRVWESFQTSKWTSSKPALDGRIKEWILHPFINAIGILRIRLLFISISWIHAAIWLLLCRFISSFWGAVAWGEEKRTWSKIKVGDGQGVGRRASKAHLAVNLPLCFSKFLQSARFAHHHVIVWWTPTVVLSIVVARSMIASRFQSTSAKP